ncbi:transporter substrate-binding domain-containing protein [Saccharothrix syringae]|uniref:Transporter substrate-binding domain-containing protein n=1 Tax=Saccharothrix syringae TaxID=103733 RepID=A0A5Q0H0C5_SACSY|nr:transporter substrate-binding domain-containing protein [Saccharothrix syringae]QFZ19375.1 transporter substrate-binding domain-containing protein [Saccharothrix syringae]
MRWLLVLALVLAGCGLPRDVEGTLDRVRAGVLRAGVTDNPPWTRAWDEAPAGVEVELVERFAAGLGARVEWRPGSESTLMTALEGRELDLVVGGLEEQSPWVEQASLTRPYAERHVWALPLGENAWQVEVEEFLATLPDGEVERLLDRA